MLVRRSLAVLLLTIAAVAVVASMGARTAVAQNVDVSVVDNQFSPASVSMGVQSSLTWTFNGSNGHTVTADPAQPVFFDSHPSCTSGGACGRSGDIFIVSFPQPGTYRYFCKVHGGPGGAGMSGVVQVTAAQSGSPSATTVTPSPSTTQSTPSPEVTPSANGSPDPSTPRVTPTLNAPSTAVAGVLIAVSGFAEPGALVELYGVTAPNGTLTKVNDTVADSNGFWTRSIRPLRNVNLQARSRGLSSATRFIAVSTAVRESVTALSGCVIQVSGSVFEPKPGRTVFLRAVDPAGRTVAVGNGTVQSDGRFLLRRAYTCGQTLRVYAVIEGDNVNRPGGTATQTITTGR